MSARMLPRLQEFLAGKAEQAYHERDSAEEDSPEAWYAAGAAHAYGIAEREVRREQRAIQGYRSEGTRPLAPH